MEILSSYILMALNRPLLQEEGDLLQESLSAETVTDKAYRAPV